MAKTKGIKINDLAHEMNVQPKQILQRLRDEGLGDAARNAMSVIAFGLAETVRDWFKSAGGDVATAVADEAPPESEETEEAAEARHKARTRKRKTEEHEPQVEHPEVVEAQGPEQGEPAAPPAPAPPAPAPPAPAQSPTPPVIAAEATPPAVEPAPATEATAAPHVAPAPSPAPVAPAVPAATQPAAPPAPSTVVAPALAAPATPQAPAVAASATPAVPAPPVRHGPVRPNKPQPRVVTMATTATTPPGRKPITPAPRLMVPEPAKIQGPKIVREEAPDVVPTPRSRMRPTAGGPAPAFVQARPQAGRGVRSAKSEEEEEAERRKKASRTLSSRRRGPDGRRGEAMEKLKEWSEQDLAERSARLANAGGYRAAFDGDLRKKSSRGQRASRPATGRQLVELEEPITIRTLSAALGVKSGELIMKLMRQGVMTTINQSLDREVAATLALDYGVDLEVPEDVPLEEQLENDYNERAALSDARASRPPVVTILGHVDHGKTSLLDKIRNANVAAGEAGGITQHTAAWMVELPGQDGQTKRVTFIDTPGHQAFTAMRARGANMTDVVVLVVSAAEGVQPQTIESINHAKAAGVPIVVAMNKIDRPDSNPDMILGQLAKEGLNPVEWGGDTEVVRTSAVTGQGVADLIEILDYQSQLLDLKADPTLPARGMVIESFMDEGLGPVATVLVQDGTLKVGDILIAGASFGRIRTLLNDRRGQLEQATASTPVIVSGLGSMPDAGEKFFVLGDMDTARAIAEERQLMARQEELGSRGRVSLENLYDTMKAGDVKEIRLIIKGDVQGSVETLAATVTQANTDEVKIRVIHTAVGPISESDVELADASDAVIIGFHVVPDDTARAMAEQRRVEVRLYRVIYELLDDLKKALSGLLEPEIREKYHGRVEVRQTFKVPRIGMVAGCMVTDGHVQRGSKIRLIRNGVIVTEDLAIDSLRRVKEDVREVKSGFECGIKLAGYDDVKVGDVLEAYVRETIQRTL